MAGRISHGTRRMPTDVAAKVAAVKSVTRPKPAGEHASKSKHGGTAPEPPTGDSARVLWIALVVACVFTVVGWSLVLVLQHKLAASKNQRAKLQQQCGACCQGGRGAPT